MKQTNKSLAYIAIGTSILVPVVTEAGTIYIDPWDMGIGCAPFYLKHGEGWNERYIPNTEDSEQAPSTPGQPFIKISSRPYPGNTDVGTDKRNKGSILPCDLIVMLTNQLTADPNLYVEVTDTTGYEHRNLTIQEIPDPCNPDDPLNPNLEYDILERQATHGCLIPGSAPLQQNVPRYWRVRCYTNPKGDVDENGQVDHNDLKFITGDNWLKTTYDANGVWDGNNHHPGDRNHDGWNDFLDFAIIGEDWYKDANGDPIAKVFTPEHKGPYLAALQESAIKSFYGDKAKKVRVARLVVLPNDGSRSPYFRGAVIPELLATKEDSEPLEQKTKIPTLRRMLALSQNNHNGHLNKSYETIDHKLHANNHKASQG